MHLSSLGLFLLLPSLVCSVTPADHFTIGAQFPISTLDYVKSPGVKYAAALLMAIDEVNDKTDGVLDDLLPDTKIQYIFRSPLLTFVRGALAGADLIDLPENEALMACVGPAVKAAISGTAPILEESGHIPLVTYSERHSHLGESKLFPNVLRVVPGDYLDARVIATMCEKFFKWEKVTVFATLDEYGVDASYLFEDEALLHGVDILSTHLFNTGATDLSSEIESAQAVGARIFVLFVHPRDAVNLLEQGTAAGLFGEDKQIIGGEFLSRPEEWRSAGITSHNSTDYLKGFIGVRWHQPVPSTPLVPSFIERWRALPNTMGELQSDGSYTCNTRQDSFNSFYLHKFFPNDNTSETPICAGMNFSSYATDGSDLVPEMYAYDAMISVLQALHNLMYEEGRDGDQITPEDLGIYMHSSFNFTGVTGEIAFSNAYKHLNFDVGGRDRGLQYEMVNYVAPTSHCGESITLQTKVYWHSEKEYVGTDSSCTASSASSCHGFVYNTADGSIPLDGPALVTVPIPPSSAGLIIFLTTLGLLGVVVTASVFACCRGRRIVRIAQPKTSSLLLLGLVFSYLHVILYVIHVNDENCISRMWLGELSFVLIISTLIARVYRVHYITSTMRHVVFTEKKCLVIISCFLGLSLCFLSAATALGHAESKHYVTEETQFHYEDEAECATKELSMDLLLNMYEFVLVVMALGMCWLTREISTTLSNTPAVFSAVVALSIKSAVSKILLKVSDLTPHEIEFVVAIVIVIVTTYALYVLFFDLVKKVFNGYDLNKALLLEKTTWGLGDIDLTKLLFSSKSKNNRVFSQQPSMEEKKGEAAKEKEREDLQERMLHYRALEKKGLLAEELHHLGKDIERLQREYAMAGNLRFTDGTSSNSFSATSNNNRTSAQKYESSSVVVVDDVCDTSSGMVEDDTLTTP